MRDYTDLTLSELNTLLKERSLAMDGTKDLLVSRLEAYDAVNDPSPSPELHLSPVRCHEQNHQPRPTSLPHHLPTEPDEDYVDWGDDADDDQNVVQIAAVAEFDTALKTAAEAAETSKSKTAGDNTPLSKSSSVAGGDGHHSSQSAALSSTLIEKISKSGYKYNSIAAKFFPENSNPAPLAMASPRSPQKPTSVAPTKSRSRSPSARVANPPCSTPATPSKPPSMAPSNALSRAPVLSADRGSTATTPAKPTIRPMVAASPIKIAALVHAGSAPVTTPNAVPKVDALPATGPTAITAGFSAVPSKGDLTPKPTAATSRLRTTQSGFQFNSISALFPGDLPTPSATLTKPQSIANMVSPASTYSTNAALTPKEEEAKRLAMRAARFGTRSMEDPTARRKRKNERPGPSEADYNTAREREQMLEIEKEMEREKIRQRVTSSAKRQKHDEDDERRPENHKRHRHYHRNSASSRPHYNPHRRY